MGDICRQCQEGVAGEVGPFLQCSDASTDSSTATVTCGSCIDGFKKSTEETTLGQCVCDNTVASSPCAACEAYGRNTDQTTHTVNRSGILLEFKMPEWQTTSDENSQKCTLCKEGYDLDSVNSLCVNCPAHCASCTLNDSGRRRKFENM
jgi:hypothetical protein